MVMIFLIKDNEHNMFSLEKQYKNRNIHGRINKSDNKLIQYLSREIKKIFLCINYVLINDRYIPIVTPLDESRSSRPGYHFLSTCIRRTARRR